MHGGFDTPPVCEVLLMKPLKEPEKRLIEEVKKLKG